MLPCCPDDSHCFHVWEDAWDPESLVWIRYNPLRKTDTRSKKTKTNALFDKLVVTHFFPWKPLYVKSAIVFTTRLIYSSILQLVRTKVFDLQFFKSQTSNYCALCFIKTAFALFFQRNTNFYQNYEQLTTVSQRTMGQQGVRPTWHWQENFCLPLS